jgi:DNA-binding transcriptional LysR family regulator
MELRQIRYFAAVAEELSFSRAAVRCGISQPPLSRQIANLEAEIGTRLLDRDKHRVRLTEPGRVFYAEAMKTLGAVARAVHMTQRAAKGQTGSLALGFGGWAAYTFAPSVLRKYRALYPNVELSLHSIPMNAQLESLREKTIDVGFVMLPVPDDTLKTMLLLRDPLIVALPGGHPLAKSKTLALSALEHQDLVLIPRAEGFGYFSKVMAICKRAGFVPTIVQEVTPMESVIGLVAAGVGLSIVPSVVKRMRIAGVEFRPLREPYAVMEIALAWHRDNASPVVQAFVKMVEEIKVER